MDLGHQGSPLEEATHPLSSSGPIVVEIQHSGELGPFPSGEAMQEPLGASRPHLSNKGGRVCALKVFNVLQGSGEAAGSESQLREVGGGHGQPV